MEDRTGARMSVRSEDSHRGRGSESSRDTVSSHSDEDDDGHINLLAHTLPGTPLPAIPGTESPATRQQPATSLSPSETLPRNELLQNIVFFHGPLLRDYAESLLHHSGRPGMFLLREAVDDDGNPAGTLCLSVRATRAVSHFQIPWDGHQFEFGEKTFRTADDMVAFFASAPAIMDEEGRELRLAYPYSRETGSDSFYEQTTLQFAWQPVYEDQKKLGLNKKKKKHRKPAKDRVSMLASTESKEGYLTKLGYYVKSWKTRWFVLQKNFLTYYKDPSNKTPLGVIDLCQCKEVDHIHYPKCDNAFKIVLPKRTYIITATSQEEVIAWVDILQRKLARVVESRRNAS